MLKGFSECAVLLLALTLLNNKGKKATLKNTFFGEYVWNLALRAVVGDSKKSKRRILDKGAYGDASP